jgi:hypothetical protein
MKKVKHLRVVAPATAPDPIFFNKTDLTPGTRLYYYGASGHHVWKVVEIVTHLRERGEWIERESDFVRVLGDVITIQRTSLAPHVVRKVSFSYLRYSAIWRLA